MRKLAFCIILIVAVAPFAASFGEDLPAMTVWKSPWCGCCGSWIEHVSASGIKVEVREVEDVYAIKALAGIPERLQSCHTARIGNYMIEGHVPAADIKRLLAERPDAHGLAVPGMPSGSPGMETGAREAYDVLLLRRDGSTEVFSSYK